MVFGDVHATYEELAVMKIAIAVGERCFAQAQRLDLRSGKHDSGDVSVEDLEIVGRAFVANRYVAVIRHESAGVRRCTDAGPQN